MTKMLFQTIEKDAKKKKWSMRKNTSNFQPGIGTKNVISRDRNKECHFYYHKVIMYTM